MKTTKFIHAGLLCRLCLLVPIGLMGLATTSARAGIVECPAAAGQFSVFLSEPSGSGDAAAARQFLQRLQFELDQQRDGRWISSPATDVRFVACFKRAPALDGQDFNPTLVEGLNSQRVLLEIWGAVDSEPVAGAAPRLSAQMNYLLVPMRFAADQHEPVAAPLQRLRYPEQGAAPVQDAVQLIARPLDIDAFVAAALGFKLLRERSFEPAHANLCRAVSLLQAIAQRPLAGRSKADLLALKQFALDSAGRTLREALADPSYAKTGLLRLHDATKPCAGQE